MTTTGPPGTSTAPPMRIAPDDPDWYGPGVEDAYAWLRREAPVYRHEPGGFWVASRHDEVRRISRDPQTFSSAQGILVHDPMRRGIRSPETILVMDPPRHTTYRKLVSRAFTPRAVRRLEDRIRELVRGTLDDAAASAAPDGTVELVGAIAAPFPVLVIAEILGVPASDRDDFRRWSDAAIAAADDYESGAAEVVELLGYFTDHIEDHRRAPRDDVLSELLAAEVDGRALTDPELQIFLLTLLVAGNETTRNLVSGGVRALAEHPDQLATLAGAPERTADAVEEMLRWVTPVMTFARTATAPVDLAGTTVDAGDYVVMLYASANRDERAYGPTAGRFDVTRAPDPAHLAFGFGEHYCLGAHLARLEARVLFEELLARWPRIELAGDPVPLRSTLMNSLVELPVRVRETP